MVKVVLIGDKPARSEIVRVLAKGLDIVVVNNEDELPGDILEHISPSRISKLIIDPTTGMGEARPARNVRPEFRNKVSDNFPKSKKRNRFPFNKRRP